MNTENKVVAAASELIKVCEALDHARHTSTSIEEVINARNFGADTVMSLTLAANHKDGRLLKDALAAARDASCIRFLRAIGGHDELARDIESGRADYSDTDGVFYSPGNCGSDAESEARRVINHAAR